MKIVVLMEDTGRDPAYRSEHGLSIYVETEKHRLLVDTGKTDAFLGNAKRQGIDLAKVDTVVLSHGHYDHGGGIMSFREINPHAVIYMQQSACGGYYHGERYIGIDKRRGTGGLTGSCSCFQGLRAGNILPRAICRLGRGKQGRKCRIPLRMSSALPLRRKGGAC